MDNSQEDPIPLPSYIRDEELDFLVKMMGNVTDRLRKAESTIREQTVQMEDLASRSSASEAKAEALLNRMHSLSSTLNANTTENMSSRDTIKRLQEALRSAYSHIDMLEKEKAGLQMEVKMLTDRLTEGSTGNNLDE